jgi:hypothetical protein
MARFQNVVVLLVLCCSGLASGEDTAANPDQNVGVVLSAREKEINKETVAVQEDELNFLPVSA